MSHYYQLCDDGAIKPRHFTQMASRDELRPTRITDVRKMWREGMKVVPSVTTVLNVLDKGALTNWLIGQHLLAAWRYTPEEYEQSDDYIRRVKAKAEIEMAKAPDAGTDMHKVLEDRLNGRDTPPEFDHICDAVLMALEPYAEHGFQTERYFTHPSGFGGCADLVGDGWVIDYKTKQTADKFKPGKMAYDDHRMQLAAYREGFGMPKARCANIFISLEDGQIDFHEHTESELQHGWEMFKHALAIWQLRNGWPSEFRNAA